MHTLGMSQEKSVGLFTILLTVLACVTIAEAAIYRTATPAERNEFQQSGFTLPAGTQFSKADQDILSCGAGAKEFLKGKSDNPQSIEGIKPDFACRLQKLIQSAPGSVRIKVGVYQTTASAAAGANCQRVQCKEYNPNGGTHQQGCAADLTFNGEKPELPGCNPATNQGNPLCLWAHRTAPGLGLQFRLMPQNGFAKAEPWHVELQGANTGSCPDSATGGSPIGSSSGGAAGGSAPNSGQSSGSGGTPGSNNTSSLPTIEDVEHEQMRKDPRLNQDIFGNQASTAFDTNSEKFLSGSSGSDTATGGEGTDKVVTGDNVVQKLIADSEASQQAASTPESKGFFASAQDTLSKWWYGGLDRLLGDSSSSTTYQNSSWQSFQTSSSAPFQFRFFGF